MEKPKIKLRQKEIIKNERVVCSNVFQQSTGGKEYADFAVIFTFNTGNLSIILC